MQSYFLDEGVSVCTRIHHVGQKGIIAIMFVMWTALGIAGLLFAFIDNNKGLLQTIDAMHAHERSRSAALYCKDKVTVKLLEDNRYVPRSVYVDNASLPRRTSCTLDSFSSMTCAGQSCCTSYPSISPSLCSSTTYGEVKAFGVTGVAHDGHGATGYMSAGSSSSTFNTTTHLDAKLLFVNTPPYTSYTIYIKER